MFKLKTIFVLVLIFVANTNIYSQWNVINSGTTEDLYSVNIYSSNDVWVGSYNKILKSTNSGNSWNASSLVDGNNTSIFPANVYDIALTSPSTGIMTGLFYMGNTECIYKTTNSGANWTAKSTNSSVPLLRYLKNVDAFGTRSVAVGNSGRIAYSSNNGETWSFPSSGTTKMINDVQFISFDTVFAVYENVLLRSVNGGSTWTSYALIGSNTAISAVHNVVYVAKTSNTISKSTNYGVTFTTITLPFSYIDGAFYAVDQNTLLISNSAGIYISKNGGLYWERYILPNYKKINMFDFDSSNSGIGVGLGGYILKTADLLSAPSAPIAQFDISIYNNRYCINDSLIILNKTCQVPGYTYQWIFDNVQFDTAYNTGKKLDIVGNHALSLVVSNGISTDTLTQQINVIGHSSSTIELTTSEDTVCGGRIIGFYIANSENNATYFLRKDYTKIGTYQSGNGGTIMFSNSGLYSFSNTTTFNVIKMRSNGCFNDSAIIAKTIYVINDTLPRNTTCYDTPTACGSGITNFKFNTINHNNPYTLNSHLNCACLKQTEVIMQRTYPLTLRTAAQYGVNAKVWVDFDNNGYYNDTTELLFMGRCDSVLTQNITILPIESQMLLKKLRMRVASNSNSYQTYITGNTCASTSYCQNIQEYSVTVLPDTVPPISDFTYTTATICNTTVKFKNRSFNALSWHWDFGDSTTSNEFNPTHIYETDGSYNVTLITSNDIGSDTISQVIVIDNPRVPIPSTCSLWIDNGFNPALGSFKFDTLPELYFSVGSIYYDITCTKQFEVNAASTYKLYMGTQIWRPDGWMTLFIDYNNDGAFTYDELVRTVNGTASSTLLGAPSAQPIWTIRISENTVYDTPLRMRVYLNRSAPLYDGCTGWMNELEGSATDFTLFIDTALPVISDFRCDTLNCLGSSIHFYSASANASQFLWDFGDGTTSSQENPWHVYATPGVYTVKLKAFNNLYSDSIIKTNKITILPSPSVPVVTRNENVLNTDAMADNYVWYCNDTIVAGATSTSCPLTKSGNYYVKVSNSLGCSKSSLIYAYFPLSVGFSTTQTNTCVSTMIYVQNLSVNATSNRLDWGDGFVSVKGAVSLFSHYYTNSGIYTMKLVSCRDSICDSLIRVNYITINPGPDTARVLISGETTVCKGQNGITYSIPEINNATSYSWSLPSGATGTSTTNSINVNYGTSSISGNLLVQANNTCGHSNYSSLPIIVKTIPTTPGTISGSTLVCAGQNAVTYSIPAIPTATSYIWTLPSGVSGTSNTNSITVDFGPTSSSGTITVSGVNSCGVGAISSKYITVQNPIPDLANVINGAISVCQGQTNVIYSVPAIENATSYIWTLPNGANGSSNTNSISVDFGTSATSGDITVKGTNICGNGTLSSLSIFVNPLPAVATTIQGPTTVCQGQPNVTYSVPAIENATSYIWTLPNGATGSSDTNSISVDFGTSAISGDISVKGVNDCGNGPLSSLSIFVNPLPAVAATVQGPTTVCQGQTIVTYSVTAIENATAYIWTLPNGASGSSSTNSISVDFGTSAISGNITVKGANDCGNGALSSLQISINTAPADAATIQRQTTVCQGQTTVTYSVPAIENATAYIWTLPNGAIGNSNTNSITVDFGTSAISGDISVKGVNDCGNGALSSLPIFVNPLPAVAVTIQGANTVCQGQTNVTYSVPAIENATSYTWTLPNGATGNSNTNSISVDFGTSAISGDITVKGTNDCGNGTLSSLQISVNTAPADAATIQGPNTVCQGQTNVTYSVPAIENATSYIWTLPNGATGNSNINSISVDFGTSAISGDITVKGTNDCGNGPLSSLSIFVNTAPAEASMIQGQTTVCQGQTSLTYSVPAIENASSYIWTLPNGATGSSNTNSISVDFGTSTISGDITVKGTNDCGNGSLSSLSITVNPLPAVAATIQGPTAVCQGQTNITYSVPAIENATSYIWTLPNGAIGNSNINSISVDFGTSAISGDITVKGTNDCGNGTLSSLEIFVNTAPADAPTIQGSTTVCQGQSNGTYSVPAIENATSYIWTLPNGATGSSNTNSISVDFGTSATSGDISVKGANDCGNGTLSSLSIFVSPLPADAATIQGPTTVCQGQTNVTYSVPAIENATAYIWTLPNGATGNSNINSISVDFGTSAISGDITVKGTNDCGESTLSIYPIIVNPLPDSAGFINGISTVHQGESGVVYTVAEINNATSYIWTLPNGSTSSKSSNSITVNFGDNATSGEITVRGHNESGDGVISVLPIVVISKPIAPVITANNNILHSDISIGIQWYNQIGLIDGATEQNYIVLANGDYYAKTVVDGWSSDPSNVIQITNVGISNNAIFSNTNIYPNPFGDELVVELGNHSDLVFFEIINSIGQVIYKDNLLDRIVVKTNTFAPGIYIIKLTNGETVGYQKIVKK